MQNDAVSFSNNACEALDRGETEPAICLAREAVRRDPALWQPVHTLALAFDRLQRYDAAIACYRQTLALCPAHPQARVQLTAALVHEGRAGEAEAESLDLLRRAASDSGAWCNLGLALRQQCRTEEAIAAYRTGLRIVPDDARLHWNLSLALLALGRFEEGWREYEWRVAAGITPPSLRDEPLWRGEPLQGKSILLETEQGLGDTIQFLRYAPWLERQGARVFVDCQLRLRPLCRRWIAQAAIDYDYRVPLMSLPLITNGVLPDSFPYLEARPTDLGTGFKVGLCRAGNPANPNDRFRSIPAHLLEPLRQVSGVRWIELEQKPGECASNSCAESIEQFASTLRSLDLVITVDTLAAHLAGALGRPVWTLLNFAPDWRWLEKGDSTAWYPTMRLFRQPRAGDWQSVVAEAVAALLFTLRSQTLLESPPVSRKMPESDMRLD